MLVTLSIVHTSPTCVRYQLLDAAGKRIWSNRVVPTDAGHEGARRRLANWALARRMTVVARQDDPATIERRAVLEVAGMAVAKAYAPRPRPMPDRDPNWPVERKGGR